MPYRTSTAILFATVALIAWGLVGVFAWTINTDEERRVVDAEDAQMTVLKSAHSARIRSIVFETAPESVRLKNLLNVDVVSASYMIEEVGKISGVTVKLGDAQPESVSASDTVDPKAVGFLVSADGKFLALLHAARLFETLPIPSSVTRLEIEHTPRSVGKTSDRWHMNVYIRVLTTSDISP